VYQQQPQGERKEMSKIWQDMPIETFCQLQEIDVAA